MKQLKDPKTIKRIRRHKRIRTRVFGTTARPRLSVFRSNKHMYAQLIDDARGVTLAAASDNSTAKGKKTKSERAREVGRELAKCAKAQKISQVVFDRGGFLYTGRLRELAESAREGGLKF